MAFQIKDFVSIAAGIINWMRGVSPMITDFEEGAVARTMIEGPAAEMDELYQNVLSGLQEAIPVSVFNTFGFAALPPEAASGPVRFSTGGDLAEAAINIPAGTIVQKVDGSSSYATLANAILEAGDSYVDVLVAAQTPGTAGNAGSDTVTSLTTPITGIATVTNPAPFTNGKDAETDADRTTRFQGYVSTLSRGTNPAIVYGAKTAKLYDGFGQVSEYVANASTQEPWRTDDTQPISLVNCYVHNGSSATSADLVAQAQLVIDGYYDSFGTAFPGWKAGGVDVVVIAASDKPINITGTLTAAAGFDHATVVANAVTSVKAYIQSLDIGKTVIKAELVAIIMRDVPGVFNIVLTVPSGDVTSSANEKPIPGTVAIS